MSIADIGILILTAIMMLLAVGVTIYAMLKIDDSEIFPDEDSDEE